MTQNKKVVKVMPAGLPFIGAGAVWFILALILPIYKISMIILATVVAVATAVVLTSIRSKQMAALPPAPAVKTRAEEISRKLDVCRTNIEALAEGIKDPGVADRARSIAATLDKIADEVEKDPKDRNKVRKLANHYTSMIEDLVKKYVTLESQGQAGENISSAISDIEGGLETVDNATKALLDDLFSHEAMEVSADIAVLEQLFKGDGSENRMNFDDILK